MNKLELYIQGMQDLKEALLDRGFIEENYGVKNPKFLPNLLSDFKPEKIVAEHMEYHKMRDDTMLKDNLIISDNDIREAFGITRCSSQDKILKNKNEIIESVKFWHAISRENNKHVSKLVANRKRTNELLAQLTPAEIEKHKGVDLRIFITRWKGELRMAINKLPEKKDI